MSAFTAQGSSGFGIESPYLPANSSGRDMQLFKATSTSAAAAACLLSQSPNTHVQYSPMSAFTAQGSGGFGDKSYCFPANSSGRDLQQLTAFRTSTAAAAGTPSQITSTKQGPGAPARRILRTVPSGVSRGRTTSQVGGHSGSPHRFSSTGISQQSSSHDRIQTYNVQTVPASLVSGSSNKRKAPDDKTSDVIQDTYNSGSLRTRGVPAAAASTLLPTLGRHGMMYAQGMQALQPVSAAKHKPNIPDSQRYANSASGMSCIDDFSHYSPSAKRQRLSQPSAPWGSSYSTATAGLDPTCAALHASHDPSPCLAEAPPVWRNPQYFSSSPLPQAYFRGQAPSPLGGASQANMQAAAGYSAEPYLHPAATQQALPHGFTGAPEQGLFYQTALPQATQGGPQQSLAGVIKPIPAHPYALNSADPMTNLANQMPTPQAVPEDRVRSSSQAQPHADPNADPQADPGLIPQPPSQAGLQEPSMVLPQVPSQAHPQASVPMGRPGFREGQVVWAKCRGHPWWPAMVSLPTPASLLMIKP